MSDTNKFIDHEPGDPATWVCICGNKESSAGFSPCDKTGNDMDPLHDWPNLYRCRTCNTVIRHPTHEIVMLRPPRFRIQLTEETAYETCVTAPTSMAAAIQVYRQFADEGPENLKLVSTTTSGWLAFDRDGKATDLDDDEVEDAGSQREAPV